MDGKEKFTGKCPDFEVISAFYDGEISPLSDEGKHITDCPACQEQLKACKLLEQTIKDKLSQYVPEGLAERIKAGVHQQLELDRNAPRVVSFLPMLLKLAAAVTVCGVLGIMVLKQYQKKESPILEKTPHTVSTVKTPVHVADKKDDLKILPVDANTPVFEIPWEDIAPVSINPGVRKGLSPHGNAADSDRPVFIPGKVHQVWVVQDLNKIKKEVEEFARENKIPANKLRISPIGKDRLKVNIRMTKKQLVKLVRTCAGKGLELLSPQVPQPEQARFIGNANVPVQYNADFVLNTD